MILQEMSGDLPALPGYYFPGQATAGTAKEMALFRAPSRLQIQSVNWIASAAVTGQATNFFTINVRNRTGAGAGTAVPASLAFSSAPVTAAAQVPLPITLSGTASDLVLATGDVLTVEKAVTGTGLAMPDGIFVVLARFF